MPRAARVAVGSRAAFLWGCCWLGTRVDYASQSLTASRVRAARVAMVHPALYAHRLGRAYGR